MWQGRRVWAEESACCGGECSQHPVQGVELGCIGLGWIALCCCAVVLCCILGLGWVVGLGCWVVLGFFVCVFLKSSTSWSPLAEVPQKASPQRAELTVLALTALLEAPQPMGSAPSLAAGMGGSGFSGYSLCFSV